MESLSRHCFVIAALCVVYSRQDRFLEIKNCLPPSIKEQPTNETSYFRSLSEVKIPCLATGDGELIYTWLKNGEVLDPSSPDIRDRVTMKPGVGTLSLQAQESDEGLYQCSVTSECGTSLSQTTMLKLARIIPFPLLDKPTELKAAPGLSLILTCNPPDSIPAAKISWILKDTVDNGNYVVLPVPLDNRVTTDYNGNLYVTSVREWDERDGKTYFCQAENIVTGESYLGEEKRIKMNDSTLSYANAYLMWHSETYILTLVGADARFKCIFSGQPIPTISWTKLTGSYNKSRTQFTDYEMVITDIQYEDAGEYMCIGRNKQSRISKTHIFNLIVEAAPVWKVEPRDVTVGVEDSAVFECEANGIPTPTVNWFINGRPYEEVSPNPRRVLNGNTLTFNNVEISDSQVIQCNAANIHGSIWSDVYLYVQAVAPKIDVGTPDMFVVVEGQDLRVPCHVTGKPKPTVIWFKGDEQLLDKNLVVMENGDLLIKQADWSDTDSYRCTAENKFGQAEASVIVAVRNQTRVNTKPINARVDYGNFASFTCEATTDLYETANLRIHWLKDGEEILPSDRVIIDGGVLNITKTYDNDAGTYTCVAENGLDNDTAVAILLVNDCLPPSIKSKSAREIYIIQGKYEKILCGAIGEGKLIYTWLKNGEVLDFNSPEIRYRVAMKPGGSTLSFKAQESDEGLYQCSITNECGTSLSQTIILKHALISPFPFIDKPTKLMAAPGSSLILTCNPPVSVPKAKITWILYGWADEAHDTFYEPVPLDERVTTDYNGNLYITNVRKEDEQDGKIYICQAENAFLRAVNIGEDKRISVDEGTVSDISFLMWHSETETLALVGKEARFKCIFSGLNLLSVSWEKITGSFDSNRLSLKDFEMVISDVQYEDIGEYRCTGRDILSNDFRSHTFKLTVEAAPKWNVQPKDVTVSAGDEAVFECEANGIPTPTVSWFINGRSYQEVPPNPRRKLKENTLTFNNVEIKDSQVIQCNATNIHGSIWSDVYLYVQASAPFIEVKPEEVVVLAEDQDLRVPCQVTGKPKPTVVWFKEDQQLVHEKFEILENGDLFIKKTNRNDAGRYRCIAENRFGTAEATGIVMVRDRTRIETKPISEKVDYGNPVTFTCGVTTDPNESANLRIHWLKDGEEILPSGRVIIERGVLTITKTNINDSATYTCVAENGLDNDTAVATLLVKEDCWPPNIKKEHGYIFTFLLYSMEATIPCVAMGDGKLTYTWLKNGKVLDLNSPDIRDRITMIPGKGTLYFRAQEGDEGLYQCSVSNECGTSLSQTKLLNFAEISPFPYLDKPTKLKAVPGSSLILTCNPPYSVPKAKISWVLTPLQEDYNYNDGRLDVYEIIPLDKRITTDYKGNLYITSVRKEDQQDGRIYTCQAENIFTRTMFIGEKIQIIVDDILEINFGVNLMWHSETETLALVGKRVRFKCIFSGHPLPSISWTKVTGSYDNERVSFDGYDMVINDVQYEDAGEYRCMARNVLIPKFKTHNFNLTVESAPVWKVEPKDVTVGVEDSAVFECEVNGIPTPTVSWFINGRPYEEIPPNPRRVLQGNTLSFTNLEISDSQVIQCNATNIHGSIWSDVYLYVQAMAPVIKVKPLEEVGIAEIQYLRLPCQVAGKPKPKVVWFKGDDQLAGGKFEFMENGDLLIKQTEKNDTGSYICTAENRFGKAEATGRVLVRGAG